MVKRPTSAIGCDNDMDRAEILNGGNGRDYTPAHPLGRELTAAETAAELRRICAKVLDKIRVGATE